MLLRQGSVTFLSAVLEEKEAILSPHTGRGLRQFEVETTTQNEAQRETLLDLLRDAARNPLEEVDDKSHVVGHWIAGSPSYSFSNTNPRTRFTFALKEYELMAIEQIVIDGFAITPTAYHEDALEEGILTIKLRTAVNADGRIELESRILDDKTYFEVVRHGISDESRSMRFGKIRWAQSGESTEFELTLVDESFDDRKEGATYLIGNEIQQAHTEVAIQHEMMAALLTELVAKNVLTENDVSSIKQTAITNHRRRLHELDEVDNLEQFSFEVD